MSPPDGRVTAACSSPNVAALAQNSIDEPDGQLQLHHFGCSLLGWSAYFTAFLPYPFYLYIYL
jgi:hypothetical protein